jgi:glutaconyl-CoA decarboxylase
LGKHKFAIDNKDFEVEVGYRRGNHVDVTVNGRRFEVELDSGDAASLRSAPSQPAPAPSVAAAAPAAGVRAPAPRAAGDGAGQVLAPLAGLVLSVKVKAGDTVKAGDVLVVLEAMKMENAIAAPQDGSVQAVAVQAQQAVSQGDLLVQLG